MLLDVLVWVAVGAVMVTGLFVGSHVRAERRPKDFPATLAAVRQKLRRQMRARASELTDPDLRPLACAFVEVMLNEVNTSITPAERERLIGELADELQQPA